MAEVGLRTIRELGDWREPEMLQGYCDLSPSPKSEVVEKIRPNFPALFTIPDQSSHDAPDLSD